MPPGRGKCAACAWREARAPSRSLPRARRLLHARGATLSPTHLGDLELLAAEVRQGDIRNAVVAAGHFDRFFWEEGGTAESGKERGRGSELLSSCSRRHAGMTRRAALLPGCKVHVLPQKRGRRPPRPRGTLHDGAEGRRQNLGPTPGIRRRCDPPSTRARTRCACLRAHMHARRGQASPSPQARGGEGARERGALTGRGCAGKALGCGSKFMVPIVTSPRPPSPSSPAPP